MINTYYGLDQLVLDPTGKTFLAALLIGVAFGFALERAGFGSSRKLTGVFYFRDMTVLKVMFTALVTAMLGLSLVVTLGWLDLETQINLLPTIYGAQAIGGLIFGIGFVVGGWCPGTAAVGLASGKLDALVFLLGAVGGSIAYNETFGLIGPLRDWGAPGEVLFAFGVSRPLFALLLTFAAVAAFYLAEWAERQAGGSGKYLGSPFLRTFSLVLVVVGLGVFLLPEGGLSIAISERALLESIEAAEDHIEPQELADRLMRGEPNLVVVDVRSAAEYERFHIQGAVNVPLPELPDYLSLYKNQGTVVLYSNGMTHPAQARDVLARMGYANVYMLSDGLQGFLDVCLKPVSLRREPLEAEDARRVRTWRAFFLGGPSRAAALPQGQAPLPPGKLPGLIETAWLAENLPRPDLKIIDVRSQPAYNTGHVPGSVCLSVESLRGVVGGVSSMLLPAPALGTQVSLMGIAPTDLVVLVAGDSLRDATLIGMGLERLGHAGWGVLDGGFAKWVAEGRPTTVSLPEITPSVYPAPAGPDGFTADYQTVRSHLRDGKTVILDVRPTDYFNGQKSDEARAGHIPGAVNRPYQADLEADGQLKPRAELESAYRALIASKETPVIVHCRTGHQASQTYFVLKHLLGYHNVTWYDAGWTEWAARPELPAEK